MFLLAIYSIQSCNKIALSRTWTELLIKGQRRLELLAGLTILHCTVPYSQYVYYICKYPQKIPNSTPDSGISSIFDKCSILGQMIWLLEAKNIISRCTLWHSMFGLSHSASFAYQRFKKWNQLWLSASIQLPYLEF